MVFFTRWVVIVKPALVCPAGTVTVDGTLAALPLLASDTTMPPVGAGAVRVTVAVALTPPLTEAGLTVRLESAGIAALEPWYS